MELKKKKKFENIVKVYEYFFTIFLLKKISTEQSRSKSKIRKDVSISSLGISQYSPNDRLFD